MNTSSNSSSSLNDELKGEAIIKHYFPGITSNQLQQFTQLQNLYEHWNSQINVISRKDIDFLYEKHILHSLGIAKVIEFKQNTNIMDVGCGGGFPGIPLAILFPAVNFYLIDSIGKKIKVVNEIANSLELKNVQTAHIRAEQVTGKFEFIISRAVTEFPTFYRWVQNKVSKKQFNNLPNGILYLKGGDLEEEFKEFKKRVLFYNLNDYFKEEFFETKKVVYLPM